jgi:CheY-like chemotaxis protein
VVGPGLDRDDSLPARPARGGSILLVEDDFAIRRSIAELLTEEGYEVTCAANGREALSLVGEHAARPHLIILDLWMPSMDGLEFRRVQKSLGSVADVPVLVMTASRPLPGELGPLGLAHVLRKPVHLDDLLRNVALLISG